MHKRRRLLCIIMALLMACSIGTLSVIAAVHTQKRGNIKEASNYTARINAYYYATLKEAVEAASDNDTIYILKDFELDETIDTLGLDLTIKGEPESGIFTIKRSTGFKPFFNGYYDYEEMLFINGGHLTISGLIIDGGAVWDAQGNNTGVTTNSPMIYLYYGTMTLDDVILQNNDNDAGTPSEVYAGAVGIGIESTLIMNGGAARNNRTGDCGGAFHGKGGQIFINNAEIADNAADIGGAFYLWGGSLHLKNSEISKNTATGFSGGGIYSIEGDIMMEGSSLSDNIASSSGGGIYMTSGSLNIQDSMLSRNTAGSKGGAVCASGVEGNCGAFQIKDSKITGNSSTGSGGGIYYDFLQKLELSGEVIITANHGGNIYLNNSSYPVLLTGRLSGTDRTGITVNDASYTAGGIVVDGSGLPEGAGLKDFYHDGGGYCLEKSGKDLVLMPSQTEYAARIDAEYHKTLDGAFIASVDGDTIHLLKDVILDTVIVLDKHITIRSEQGGLYRIIRGGGMFGSYLFYISRQGDVTIKDIILDGGAEWDGSGSSGYVNSGLETAVSLVMSEGRFTMESGAVLQNNDIVNVDGINGEGGGFDNLISGTFIMNGGEITGNAISSSNGYGAGISNSGTCELRGGRITGNALHASGYSNGGGIYNTGTLIIHDGEISGNTGSANGGGIFSGQSFTMYGGRISNNKVTVKSSEDCGGGGVLIYGNGNVFTMEGGEISGNTAENGSGGGVSAYYGSFAMNGGIIKDNASKESGGGVWVHFDCSEFNMTGGSIIGNTAGSSGGGIYLTDGARLNISGGGIARNNAASGGGIYNQSSFIDYGHADIKDNIAGSGGGISVDNGLLSLAGTVSISGNKNGDIHLCTEGKPVIIKESITALNPIGLLVSPGYEKGTTVIDGRSNSVNVSLDDFFYADWEHKLSKNDYDIILYAASNAEEENTPEQNVQDETNPESSKPEYDNQEGIKPDDSTQNEGSHNSGLEDIGPDDDMEKDTGMNMNEQNNNEDIPDNEEIEETIFNDNEYINNPDDDKLGSTEQNIKPSKEPAAESAVPENMAFENGAGLINAGDEKIVQTGYQNKLPVHKFFLVIGFCLMSVTILFLKLRRKHN